MPKIAYLILAHDLPEHLPRLIHALNDRGVDFFVHVDAKADATPFLGCQTSNVHFLTERVRVFWGGWGMTAATLALMRQALSRSVPYSHLVLLSGRCYPIRSRSHIQRFLAENAGTEFIQARRMPDPPPPGPIGALFDWHYQRLSRDCHAGLPQLQAYIGSSWWALTREACQYILDFTATHPTEMQFFENARLPEEMFFQTVLANSPFASNMRMTLTFADWYRANGPHPAELSVHHVRLFEANWTERGIFDYPGACFCRKVPNDVGRVVSLINNMVRRLDGRPSRVSGEWETTKFLEAMTKPCGANRPSWLPPPSYMKT